MRSIEIPDPLYEEIQRCARTQGTDVQSLVTESLRAIVRSQPRPTYQLRDASVGGTTTAEPSASEMRNLAHDEPTA